jgi:hypothetical protein
MIFTPNKAENKVKYKQELKDANYLFKKKGHKKKR